MKLLRVNSVLWSICVLSMIAQIIWLPTAHAQDDDAEPSDDSADNTTTNTALCYSCNETDACAIEQNSENGTALECDVGKHCWTWKTEKEEVVTYSRDCGVACTDENRELNCQSIDNQTECSQCCEDELCNGGLLGSANARLLFSTVQLGAILVVSTISVILLG